MLFHNKRSFAPFLGIVAVVLPQYEQAVRWIEATSRLKLRYTLEFGKIQFLVSGTEAIYSIHSHDSHDIWLVNQSMIGILYVA